MLKDKRYHFVRPSYEAEENDKVETKEFMVLGIADEGDFKSFFLEIPNDWIGWQIGAFHIANHDTPKEFIGKKFYQVDEDFII